MDSRSRRSWHTSSTAHRRCSGPRSCCGKQDASWDHTRLPLHVGASWTTDAPFRETAVTIELCRQAGILAVEMAAAALYALAEVERYDIICFALVTNEMGRSGEDFEKGEVSGSETASTHVLEGPPHTRSWDRLA